MTRSLYWMPNQPPNMSCLNKSIPLMDAINHYYGEGSVVITNVDIYLFRFLASAFNGNEKDLIMEFIELLYKHESIVVEIRR